MERSIPVCIVGAGWVTDHAYVPALDGHRLRVVQVYDPDEARAARLAARFGLSRPAPTFDACLEPSVEGVLLCTPAHHHADQVRRSLHAGKVVLCEKPVLRGSEELGVLAGLGGLADRLVGSASTRLRPDVALVLSWVRAGHIGRLQRVELGWWRERGVPAPGSWRTDPACAPDGVFEDLAPHLLDIAAAVLPSSSRAPVRVWSASLRIRHGRSGRAAEWFGPTATADYDVPDYAHALFEAEGVLVDVKTCWTSETPGDLSTLRFVGSRGIASLQGLFGFSTTRRLSDQVCVLKVDGELVERRPFPATPEMQLRGFAASLDRFASFCDGARGSVASCAEVVQVARWMDAIRIAARRHEIGGQARTASPHYRHSGGEAA